MGLTGQVKPMLALVASNAFVADKGAEPWGPPQPLEQASSSASASGQGAVGAFALFGASRKNKTQPPRRAARSTLPTWLGDLSQPKHVFVDLMGDLHKDVRRPVAEELSLHAHSARLFRTLAVFLSAGDSVFVGTDNQARIVGCELVSKRAEQAARSRARANTERKMYEAAVAANDPSKPPPFLPTQYTEAEVRGMGVLSGLTVVNFARLMKTRGLRARACTVIAKHFAEFARDVLLTAAAPASAIHGRSVSFTMDTCNIVFRVTSDGTTVGPITQEASPGNYGEADQGITRTMEALHDSALKNGVVPPPCVLMSPDTDQLPDVCASLHRIEESHGRAALDRVRVMWHHVPGHYIDLVAVYKWQKTHLPTPAHFAFACLAGGCDFTAPLVPHTVTKTGKIRRVVGAATQVHVAIDALSRPERAAAFPTMASVEADPCAFVRWCCTAVARELRMIKKKPAAVWHHPGDSDIRDVVNLMVYWGILPQGAAVASDAPVARRNLAPLAPPPPSADVARVIDATEACKRMLGDHGAAPPRRRRKLDLRPPVFVIDDSTDEENEDDATASASAAAAAARAMEIKMLCAAFAASSPQM